LARNLEDADVSTANTPVILIAIYTPSAGPIYQSCGCNNIKFGCCPYLITVAK
jgi:hypothetical protein